ncbi:hypothetical protein CGLO_16670 [Colletotrichum gloeosporioides Cg-14]|uniref:Uncharacterized protein n=1 Tax=Colletotrichum gloeosporioides (strain Cg-14) TaxID=1237896 RepID=T0KZ01_COLGC|nr:hypothetical protein CGLO_16670 [Colletotrichum gloeosporioides Cg-14]
MSLRKSEADWNAEHRKRNQSSRTSGGSIRDPYGLSELKRIRPVENLTKNRKPPVN